MWIWAPSTRVRAPAGLAAALACLAVTMTGRCTAQRLQEMLSVQDPAPGCRIPSRRVPYFSRQPPNASVAAVAVPVKRVKPAARVPLNEDGDITFHWDPTGARILRGLASWALIKLLPEGSGS